MRCKACNNVLGESEVVWNKQLGEWEICGTCLDIALEAAFSGDFSPDHDEIEEGASFIPSVNETLDPDTFRSWHDHVEQGHRLSEE